MSELEHPGVPRKLTRVLAILGFALLCFSCSDNPSAGDQDTVPVDVTGSDPADAASDVGTAETKANDTGTSDSGKMDTTGPSDTPLDAGPDETTSELPPPEDAQGDAGDGDSLMGWDTIKSDCEELGIADSWTGTFQGLIEHDVTPPDGINLTDEPIPVDGELTFAITCVDSKLQVNGKLDGFGLAAGEAYPFTLTLKGYYDPKTELLTADITEGMVLILDALEVYFKGSFNGALAVDIEGNPFFSGDWSAVTTGTNAGELIVGEAWGDGTWTANPDE